MKPISRHYFTKATSAVISARLEEGVSSGYLHNQVEISGSGYTVDENIHDLVVAVNKTGLITQFSCEGEVRLVDFASELDNTQFMSHLIFEDMAHAFEFYKITTDHLGAFWHSTSGSLMLIKTLMAYDREKRDFRDTGARAGVWFDPRELENVTDLWVELASQNKS